MSKIKKKLIIGTTQFYKRYGLSRTKIHRKEAKKLIKFLRKKNLLYFDDALSYNFSKTLKDLKINGKNFKLTTKIPKYDGNPNYEKKALDMLTKNLIKSNLKKYDSILLHDTMGLNKSEIINSISFLKKLKRKHITKKIGFSLYHKKDFYSLRKHLKPDVIQAPVNIFDQDFLESSFRKKLEKEKITFYARSIFLQGLLITDKIPKYFKKIEPSIRLWNSFCKKNKVSKIDGCLNFVNNQSFIKKIIIGVKSVKEVNQILDFKKKNIVFEKKFKNLKLQKKYTKPYLWQKN
tara:strand:+ start:32 stop:904 length:873 start_codon:yes stop_codon:yes gene_type:complete